MLQLRKKKNKKMKTKQTYSRKNKIKILKTNILHRNI
jgi:hypothetical protein